MDDERRIKLSDILHSELDGAPEHLTFDILAENPVLLAAEAYVRRNPEHARVLMYSLTESLRKFPHLPLKHTINLGEEEPTMLSFEHMSQLHAGKVEIAKQYQAAMIEQRVAEAMSLARDFFTQIGMSDRILGQSVEATVTMPSSFAMDPRQFTPVFNLVTAARLEHMATQIPQANTSTYSLDA